ncbi:hypothetical protein VTI28DRAFT_2556 [Corynascus sepedonium]
MLVRSPYLESALGLSSLKRLSRLFFHLFVWSVYPVCFYLQGILFFIFFLSPYFLPQVGISSAHWTHTQYRSLNILTNLTSTAIIAVT